MESKYEEVGKLAQDGVASYYESHIYESFEKKATTSRGWFVIKTNLYQLSSFKEIKQVRKYTFQSMIGNSGGYIGLLVGITISSIPCFLFKLYSTIKGRILSIRTYDWIIRISIERFSKQ